MHLHYYFIKRCLTTQRFPNLAKKIPSLKGRSKSSQEWLTRQLGDPYVEKAKMQNYRCRSAFKLLEINDKFKIIKSGDVVIDCGAAPGSWTQVAVNATNALGTIEHQKKGAVFATDLLYFHEVLGAKSFGGMDFRKPQSQLLLKEALTGRVVNCVLSDMAPNATGVRVIDQECIMNLCYSVLAFSLAMSEKGANLVLKVWDNGNVPKLEKDIGRFYEKVKRFKPNASRGDSAEQFLVARNFIGSGAVSLNESANSKNVYGTVI